MAYKQNPGRGSRIKTGAGIPSPLLQVKDEKSGENRYPGYKKPVYKQPFEGENLTSEESFANYDARQDFDRIVKVDSIRESKMKGKWPVRWESYNIGGRGKKIDVSVEDINQETGDVSYQNTKTGKRNTASRSAWRDMTTSGRSLKRFQDREKYIAESKNSKKNKLI